MPHRELPKLYASLSLVPREVGTALGRLLLSRIEATARYVHLACDSEHEAAERVAASIAGDILTRYREITRQTLPDRERGRMTRVAPS